MSACPCRGSRCKLSAESHRHGSRSGYAKHGCRCDPCTDAQADYMAEWASSNRERVAANKAAHYLRKKGLSAFEANVKYGVK